MIFNLYRISYHPEYINVRLEHISYINGYESNIHDIVQAEQYFLNYLLVNNLRVVTVKDGLSNDPNNLDENGNGAIDLGYFITSNVDTLAESYSMDNKTLK